ncbi:heat shock protein DnaJ domain protein [Magnetococcus marinus MC-1]|uniref:Heat shock protein DnaJ domain protein n=2 Tax=Magnetococcus TaxID=162171 RepID=A0L547_MAGMM|nr:heat shock protein DnaJ domain protein [Magnetococcus marinus MC-1]
MLRPWAAHFPPVGASVPAWHKANVMQQAVEEILTLLENLLRQHPEGLKEFTLYQILKERQIEPFAVENLQDPEVLFRVHFLLFHHLYRLRERLWQQGQGMLHIHCLCIKISPTPAPTVPPASPIPYDALAGYYLDLQQLEQTTRAQVEQLLNDFWARFERFEGLPARSEALAVLDLPGDADAARIKRRYRELAKQHHPDRGGAVERFREIAQAAESLRNH